MTRVLAFLAALLWLIPGSAEMAVPALHEPVVDLTGTLSPGQKVELSQLILDLEHRKGAQIALLLVPSTQGEAIEQYALRVAESWKLGRKSVDDGALLLVAKEDRTMRIEVGYGLEGVLTDATSRRIIGDIITPHFREGDFYGGLRAGLTAMIGLVDGEPLPAPQQSGRASPHADWLPFAFALMIGVGAVLRTSMGAFLGAASTGLITAVLSWLLAGTVILAAGAGVLAFLLILLGDRRGPGNWHSGGGFGTGGFGSGGFSSTGGSSWGGRGGGFGGGGASGRW